MSARLWLELPNLANPREANLPGGLLTGRGAVRLGCRLALVLLGLLAGTAAAATRELRADFALRTEATPASAPRAEAASALVFLEQPDGTAFRLEIGAASARLVRSSQAGAEVVAGPVALGGLPAGPLPVLVRRLGGRLVCAVGPVRLAAVAPEPAAGGFRVEPAPGGPDLAEPKVQPLAPLTFADDFMRGADEAGPWQTHSGTWALDRLPNADWTPNAFRYLGRAQGHGLAVAGEWFWDGLTYVAAVQPGSGSGAAGLAAYVQADGAGLVYRWVGEGEPRARWRAGALELAWVRADGGEEVLARQAWPCDPRQWYAFGLAVLEGHATAFLDGRAVLTATAPALSGRLGLYSRDTAGARFDDVAVRSLSAGVLAAGDRAEIGATDLPRQASSVAERFRNDQYMQAWASELGSWVRNGEGGPTTYRHLGLFPGDLQVAWAGHEPVRFDQGPLELQVTPEAGGVAEGYSLRLTRSPEGVGVDVTRRGVAVASQRLPLAAVTPIQGLSVARLGRAFRVTVNQAEVEVFADPQPLVTRRLGVVCAWTRPRELHAYTAERSYTSHQILPAVQDLVADGPNLHDYLFDRAPVDWVAESGTWEITPRWICLPMFSWLGGRSHENAVFWNKRRLAGDVVVDVHAAVMMDYGPMSGYDRYGDLCVTVCGDGRDLSSGYTAQFGAEGNTVSRLWRGDRVVAEDRSVTYPPRSEGAHQNWYHLTVVKRGAEVRFLVDNRPVAAFTDPEPLAGGHVALWTWNRGMMVARARIWAETDEGVQAEPFLRPLAAGPAPVVADASRPTVDSATHAGVFFGFDRGAEGWGSSSRPYGAAVAWEPGAGGGVLRCLNPGTGGDVSTVFPVPAFEARTWPRLELDAQFATGTRVNLYFRALGRWHVVGLTGPVSPGFHQVSESREISGRLTAVTGLELEQPPPVCLGDLRLTADGTWQHVQVDLLEWLERQYPRAERLEVRDLQIANWSNAGYLQCGFGGNRLGAAYRLDNVWLGAPGAGRVAEFAWTDPSPAPAADPAGTADPATAEPDRAPWAWAWRIDRAPDSLPDAEPAPGLTSARIDGLASGPWFLHRLGVDGDGVAHGFHHRFVVDAVPPVLVRTDPADGQAAAPGQIALSLAEAGGSGVDRESFELAVAGRAVTHDRLRWDVRPDSVEVLADLAGFAFADGQPVPCEVRARDRAGNALIGDRLTWQWAFARAADRTPPSRPGLTAPPPSAWDESFEEATDEWGRFPGSAWAGAALDDSTAVDGARCLRVSGGPGPYRCYVRRRPFDLRAHPVLLVDYRAAPGAVWDLAVETEHGWSVVAASGGTTTWRTVGRLPGYTADDRWHTAVLPLGQWLAQTRAGSATVVRAVAVVADRMEGGSTTEVRLDALRLAPALWPNPAAALAWQADDTGGVAGYRWRVDDATVADPPADGALGDGRAPLAGLRPGLHTLHVRAWDQAGNPGPVLHQAFVVQPGADTAPPRVLGLEPAPDSRAATDRLRVRFAEEGSGLALESLALAVGGRRYTFADPEVSVDAQAGVVEWRHLPGDTPETPAFAAGTAVRCRLEARDRAGNPLAEPADWAWTMDPAEDHTGPVAPQVSWTTDEVFLCEDFEAGIGLCIGLREGWTQRCLEQAGTGGASLRFGGYATFLCASAYDAERFPYVSFLYRFGAGSRANLSVRCENRNWEVRLNGDGAKYPLIGHVDGIVADGRWHACRFNLADLLRQAPAPPRTLAVDHIGTLVREGDDFGVDDITVEGPGSGLVRARWSVPADPTGIAGYGLTLDDRPDTVPAATVNTPTCRTEFRVPASGWTWLHVRAVDGAGNAGQTVHVRIEPGPVVGRVPAVGAATAGPAGAAGGAGNR